MSTLEQLLLGWPYQGQCKMWSMYQEAWRSWGNAYNISGA